jgi:hypothetical protein
LQNDIHQNETLLNETQNNDNHQYDS